MTHSSLSILHPTRRALITTALFALVALVAHSYTTADPTTLLIFYGFYALLLAHTYLSVRTFPHVIPHNNVVQIVLDGTLAILYGAMPFVVNQIALLLAIGTTLFLVASLKYILPLKRFGATHLLYRKIIADVLGGILTVLALIGVTLGFEYPSLILWLAIFAASSAYYFFIRPLYNVDHMAIPANT